MYSKEIKKAAIGLSERYRKGIKPYLRTELDRHAYLITRLPATQAAIQRVLKEIKQFTVESYLDIGAGPATSWGAVTLFWPQVKATMIEKDRIFFEIGKRATPPQVKWMKELSETPHDLVLFSYSWGEIDDLELLSKAWKLARQFLVVIEPGTPRGYENVLKARSWCIEQGGAVVAPCPHSQKCPWQGTDQWCHFGVRLERSREHQLAKEGSLGFEDEKFSYTILSKQPQNLFSTRLLKDPLRRKGHTVITLCTPQGVEEKTVTKSQKDQYKMVNKLKWGDCL